MAYSHREIVRMAQRLMEEGRADALAKYGGPSGAPESAIVREYKKAFPGWLGKGAAPGDYLIAYDGGWYAVDHVRRSGEVGNEVAEVRIADWPSKGDAMREAIQAAHDHAARNGVQSAVVWRVGHDNALSQIGHVGTSHRQPVIANPGWGDEDEDDDEQEGDLRYANPSALAKRLKNAL